jgi:hypothetical protein
MKLALIITFFAFTTAAHAQDYSALRNASGDYDTKGAYSCTDVHKNVCIAFCRENKRSGSCDFDCDNRLKYCMANGAYMVRQGPPPVMATNLKKQ